ncbi:MULTISPECIES: SDR family NAD(P)-dependent oxidoreductase [unclassified Pseudoclavibacter]|uniref:SDR family NAD(P)-dependent oxidoreductase n=1 Tax=unclassified Pseudoclavibacter TaxID=2615177 RepID=UPI0012EF3797|nr:MULTISPECIES: SDR family NAD(P)-dependent oxidoreductase [unclassified Pseudoclavibacter]MBF4458901.1 SDR family oxidoreductase [Pseudoclavibacter sp. VKM Ac-2867]VXC33216.1 3-oxoacyl-(acyl-carrier-protein) reductase FabG [Pseudoclavibacter sp. 8L]
MGNSRSELTGRVALVTGGARGIGREIARSLAGRGAHVVVVDVIDGAEAVADIQSAMPGSSVDAVVVDVRDRAQVRACVDDIVERHGSLDVVVNNAGTCGRLDLEVMDDDTWERDLATNLRGTFLFTQAAIYPHMKERGWGRIVNVSSISGIMGGPPAQGEGAGRSGPAYAASKGGVIAFTKWVAKEVGELGITVNTVAPGPIATPMTAGLDYDFDGQAIKRMGEPEDIADAVAFLASEGAGYVTGETLKVCGGSAIG